MITTPDIETDEARLVSQLALFNIRAYARSGDVGPCEAATLSWAFGSDTGAFTRGIGRWVELGAVNSLRRIRLAPPCCVNLTACEQEITGAFAHAAHGEDSQRDAHLERLFGQVPEERLLSLTSMLSRFRPRSWVF
jgi:hypothetical protein